MVPISGLAATWSVSDMKEGVFHFVVVRDLERAKRRLNPRDRGGRLI